MARVLLIDSDDTTRRSSRDQLEGAGFTVFDAGDSVSAELLLDDMAFDVVVGDADMNEGRLLDMVSGTNPGEALALLILITDPDSAKQKPDSVNGAAFDYLQRPFDPVDLCFPV